MKYSGFTVVIFEFSFKYGNQYFLSFTAKKREKVKIAKCEWEGGLQLAYWQFLSALACEGIYAIEILLTLSPRSRDEEGHPNALELYWRRRFAL